MIHKLYGGKVLLEFDEIRHQFTIDGERILGVTSCTGMIDKSRPLIYWAVGLTKSYLVDNIDTLSKLTDPEQINALIEEAGKQHQIKKEQAATIGSQVHKWVEQFIKAKVKKEVPELPDQKKDPQVFNGVLAFMKWADEHQVKFLSSERFVYSKKHNYAGIMDCEAVINGKKSVVDFKTSNGIYNEMRYQVAAYQAAVEEEEKKKYPGDKWIVRFGKEDGEFEAHQYDDHEKDFEVFLAALTIKRRDLELYVPYKKKIT
jgi:hypothetical protein